MEGRRSPKPTNAELAILSVLWERGASSVRETHEGLPHGGEVGYTTVLKTMQIMADKGLLSRVERGRAHVYRPVVAEEVAKRDLVGDLMDRAFAGSAHDLVMHALAAKPASGEEVAEIRRLLDRMEAERG